MQKLAFLASVLAFSLSFAVEVDVTELKKAKRIEFINYAGPGRNDPTAAVRGIGFSLADNFRNNRADFLLKYSIVRVDSADEPEKYAADIFSIHKDAQVDNVNNIRKILSAFYERKFGYTRAEADALAVFTTYYNAFYRGNVQYFAGIYKKSVVSQIRPFNAGLAVRWNEWPGATKILIPLTQKNVKGEIGLIDPTVIADKKVIAEVRKDDANIEARKTVADLKEKEIAKEKEDARKAAERAAAEKKAADQAKADAEAARRKAEADKKAVAEREKEVAKKEEAARKIPDPVKRAEEEKRVAEEKKEVAKQKEEAVKKEEEAKKKEDTAVTKEKEAEKKTEEADKKAEEVAKKEEAVAEEKKDIASDELKRDVKKGDPAAVDKLEKKEEELAKKEEELKKKEEELKKGAADRNVLGERIYYLKIREFLRNGHYNNDLCMIDATNRKLLFNSPVPNISGSRYDLYSGGIVVITRVDFEYTQHRLTLVDKDKLTALKTGADNIFYRSFVEIRDDRIYAIINDKEQFFLGCFDKDLKLVAKSPQRISQDTFITFFGDWVYINSEDKKIMVLKKADLSFVDKIDPDVIAGTK